MPPLDSPRASHGGPSSDSGAVRRLPGRTEKPSHAAAGGARPSGGGGGETVWRNPVGEASASSPHVVHESSRRASRGRGRAWSSLVTTLLTNNSHRGSSSHSFS